jgi:hypothetical protein
MGKIFDRILMTESKTYGSLDSEVAKKIMKVFKLEIGYVYASRGDESREWKVVHYWGRNRRKTLGTLEDIIGQL